MQNIDWDKFYIPSLPSVLSRGTFLFRASQRRVILPNLMGDKPVGLSPSGCLQYFMRGLHTQYGSVCFYLLINFSLEDHNTCVTRMYWRHFSVRVAPGGRWKELLVLVGRGTWSVMYEWWKQLLYSSFWWNEIFSHSTWIMHLSYLKESTHCFKESHGICIAIP